MNRKTQEVIDAASRLPEFERAVPLEQLLSILDCGNEKPVLEAALELPEADRWAVVDRLPATTERGQEELWEESWRPVIERRLKEIEDGTAELLTWEEVKQRLDERAPRGTRRRIE